VLHVVTVHFRTDIWIEPQRRYLQRFVPSETQVWASLDGIEQGRGFDHETTLDGSHAEKLNELARMVSAVAAPEDHLLFLDGDAFPVAPLAPVLAKAGQLIAVKRLSPPLPVPHACFCLTTVGFWNDLGGDWREGSYYWQADGRERVGEVTDVGAKLTVQLKERGVEWQPLLRLNTRYLRPPTAFCIYGNEALGPVVYHHGAGFRSRSNPLANCWIPNTVPILGRLERSTRFRARRLRDGRSARDVLAMIHRDDDLVENLVGD
jgi:hypothetical protein